MPDPGTTFSSTTIAVILLGITNAVLVSAGVFFQKMNGVHGAGAQLTVWTIAAAGCLVPTFFVANAAFALGGKVTVFVPLTTLSYPLVLLIGRLAFGETFGLARGLGCFFVLLGVAIIIRS